MPKKVGGVAGIFSDEKDLLNAARKLRETGLKNVEAISPFPIHGIEDALGIQRSFLPWVTFGAGLTGCLLGILWLNDVAAVWWPLNIGGKPFNSWPAFVPIYFEMTVLFGALCTVGVLFWICGLPRMNVTVIDPSLTDDHFALFVPESQPGFNMAKIDGLFRELGAVLVRKINDY